MTNDFFLVVIWNFITNKILYNCHTSSAVALREFALSALTQRAFFELMYIGRLILNETNSAPPIIHGAL